MACKQITVRAARLSEPVFFHKTFESLRARDQIDQTISLLYSFVIPIVILIIIIIIKHEMMFTYIMFAYSEYE